MTSLIYLFLESRSLHHDAVQPQLLSRNIYSSPPPVRTRIQDNPTLLYSWWCTGFAMTIILFRLAGRYVRTECLFLEDKIMALSIIPLLIRMGFVHVILIYGTNNVVSTNLTDVQIHQREIGSRLVLCSRIFYAAFIWTCKLTVCSFLKRLTQTIWRRSYEIGLQTIRIFLFVTFFAVLISDLAECIPITHYWQVVPDPGAQCRQGFAQLLTMGICDIMTDVMLVIFPVPIVLRSAMTLKRKIQLILLFGLSIVLIVITAYRMPAVIAHQGQQQYRTVWASSEILAAAGVSNALILGSFLRDRGLKKPKYKFNSITDSMDGPSLRRNITHTLSSTASDEDLIRGFGFGAQADLDRNRRAVPRPAPLAIKTASGAEAHTYRFPREAAETPGPQTQRHSESSSSNLTPRAPSPGATEITLASAPRNLSFFDVGGLLDTPSIHHSPSQSTATAASEPATAALDWANPQSPPPRRGSRALLSDLGALLPARAPAPSQRRGRSKSRSRLGGEAIEMSRVARLREEEGGGRSKSGSRSRSTSAAPTGVPSPHLDHDRGKKGELMDVGGLLR